MLKVEAHKLRSLDIFMGKSHKWLGLILWRQWCRVKLNDLLRLSHQYGSILFKNCRSSRWRCGGALSCRMIKLSVSSSNCGKSHSCNIWVKQAPFTVLSSLNEDPRIFLRETLVFDCLVFLLRVPYIPHYSD